MKASSSINNHETPSSNNASATESGLDGHFEHFSPQKIEIEKGLVANTQG